MASQITPSEGRVIRVPIFPGTEEEWDSHGSSLRLEERTATLRCGEENSSAKIVINNFSFRLAQDLNFYKNHPARFFFIHHFPRPFNHRHAIRLQEFLQPGGHNLPARFEPVQIQMKQPQPPAAIFVHQRERRRMHPRRDAESARDALHELRFARAQLAGQADDQSALRRAPPALAERPGLRRTMRNECSHETMSTNIMCNCKKQNDEPLTRPADTLSPPNGESDGARGVLIHVK